MKIVQDLMTPLEAYTRVPETASLHDVIQALEKALLTPDADPTRPRARAVLVQARDGQVIGKLSIWDVLRGLEPRYGHPIGTQMLDDDSFLRTHSLLVNLAKKAKSIRARDLVLGGISKDEVIKADAPLDLAVHQLVHGKLLSLLVVTGDSVVGILRLSDVFRAVSEMVKQAEAGAERV